MHRSADVAATFLRWTFLRAACHRGYWLVTSLYLVTVADLSATQLLLMGTVMGVVLLVAEVPTGVLADTVSRRWSIVVAQLLIGSAMVMTGLVTAFPLLAATQVLWGLGWAFMSGADVAWVSDELDQPTRIARVLVARGRWEQVGAVAGMVGFGTLAWVTDLATSIVASGVAMSALTLFVLARFTEDHFTPTREHRWRESVSILGRGVALSRRDRQVLVMFTATVLVNGGDEGFVRLYPKRLVEVGFPAEPDPVLWFAVLGVVSLAAGIVALRIIEARIDGDGTDRRAYVLACAIGASGLVVLAHAPTDAMASAGVVLVGGVALTVTRAVSVIWVDRRATSDVRATVQSFLSQAESFGEILCGLALAAIAQASSLTLALMASCVLVAAAGVVVARSRPGRAVPALPAEL